MGVPIGMRYRTSSYSANVWDTYWFERNLQGDITAIYNASGTKLVSYKYDAWGNHTPAYSNGGVSIVPVVNNPLRYRGYYYDSDLGLYYLQSRYYDSKTGRFINADSALYEGLLGSNMYAYCENNPVMYVDYSGENAALALGTWLGVATPIAFAEPTLIGEIVVVAGVVALLFVAVCELAEAVDDSKNDSEKDAKAKEAPKSVPKNDKNNAPATPDVKYPGDDPTVAPDGYEWTGPDAQGGKRGGYTNKDPNKRDSWHPDLNHPDGVKPHWDYNDDRGHKWRVFPDHVEFVPK